MKLDRRLKRPEWFTKEKYIQLREEGYSKQDIYESVLFVSQSVFERFLDEIDGHEFMKGQRKRKYKRPSWFTFRKYDFYKQQGVSDAEIQEMLHVSYPVFRRFLDEIGVPKRPIGPAVRLNEEETA